jgi:hypothetical protein
VQGLEVVFEQGLEVVVGFLDGVLEWHFVEAVIHG